MDVVEGETRRGPVGDDPGDLATAPVTPAGGGSGPDGGGHGGPGHGDGPGSDGGGSRPDGDRLGGGPDLGDRALAEVLAVPAGGAPVLARPAAPARVGRRPGGALPYGLVLPSVLALAGLLAYPLVTLVITSFKQLNLRELIRRQTVWVGTDNYARILTDRTFWTVTVRTLVFAAVCVVLTLAGGTLVALLMRRLGTVLRLLVSVSMLLAWATPTVSAATVFKWLFDQDYGVVNWAVTTLTPLDWSQRS